MGYGTYAMGDMKLVQSDYRRNVGVWAKATDEFPAYFQRGLLVSLHLTEQNRISLLFEQGSTGGRLAYEDYSGSLRLDQLLRYTSFGGILGREHRLNGISLMYGLESTVILSSFRMELSMQVDGDSYTNSEDFKAVGLGAKPMLAIGYHYKRFLPRLSIGYLINHSQKPFHLKNDELSVLMLQNQELAPDWSGLRLTLSLGYTIGGKREEQVLPAAN